MERDGMSECEALDLIQEAQDDFNCCIESGNLDSAEQICSDWFGLEPDYLIELF